jgi:hypothetical protein
MKTLIFLTGTMLVAACCTGCTANRSYSFRVDDTSDQSRVVTYRDAMEQAVSNSRKALLESAGS